MKKSLFALAALATFFAFSCTKEQQFPDEQLGSQGITLTVSAENNITKGTYSDAGQFTWAAGDKIGVNAWMNTDLTDHWPAPLTLKSEDAGKTVGNFEDTAFDTSTKTYGTVAFYPWNGYAKGTADENGTNVGDDGKLYVHLKPVIAYNNDSSHPQHLLPLAATITDNQTDPIQFKQLGAGIKVSVKNVPTKANKISLTIPGKNITGWYTIEDLSKIDTGEAFISSTDGSDSMVAITFDQGSAARDMDFVFPVPTGAIPGMEIRLYSDNAEIYKRVAPAQPTLTRGQLLTNDSITIDGPYYLFGWINESNYACEENASSLGEYRFANGKLKFLSSKDAYIAVKDANNNWYMTTSYVDYVATGTSADLYNTASNSSANEKMRIPANTAVELTLTKNGDHLTLSYTAIPSVTLYFRDATPVDSKACICSSKLGTADWPGTEMTETETIAGSVWYKFTTTPDKVWDKSVNFYFHGGSWATSETWGDFSKHKTEYYFVAEKDKVARQLSGRPADWSFASSYGVDWTTVTDAVEGRTTAGYDAIRLLKATGNASRVFLYFKMKRASLYDEPTYEYANLLKIYFGDSASTTDFDWQWTSKYTVKFNSWLQMGGVPNYITYDCPGTLSHVDCHDELFVDEDISMVYYELSIPRSFDTCLQGTTATVAMEANQQYVVGGSWQGSSSQIGFAPTCWRDALSFTLPTYVAE